MADEYIYTISPSTQEVIVKQPVTSLSEAKRILENSQRAFEIWRQVPLAERITILRQVMAEIQAKKALLGRELTEQMGRPIQYSEKEIETMSKRADYLFDICEKSLGSIPGIPEEGFKRYVTKEPKGCCLLVFAWNFPYLILISALLPALLAGNSVVLKPSPQTPLVAERIIEICNKTAGIPKDLVQSIHVGSPEKLNEILQLPGIDQINFTGSTVAGVSIQKSVSDKLIPLNMELGGNDPAYVRSDVDLGSVADSLVDGAVFNSGQSCCAVERIYVHQDVHDAFVEEVQKVLKGYILGDPTSPATHVGPIISQTARTTILAHISDALQKGAKDATPPNTSFDNAPANGNYIRPTLLTHVDHSMRVMKEETFGPVIPIMKISSDEQAIELMNDSEYGLTASVWTRDIETGEKMLKKLEAGTCFVNRCDYPSPDLAWTGWKKSGLGWTMGPHAFEPFYRLKSYHVKSKH